MVSSIIVAAGSGKRMGGTTNKVFMDLAGAPVLFHSIRAFQEHPAIDEIIMVLRADEIDYFRQIAADQGFSKIRQITSGGAERMDSVHRGLACLDETSELVLIHDGARPFVSGELISQAIASAREHGAACPGVIPKDTIKLVDETGLISGELVRNRLRALQTPQAFSTKILQELMTRAIARGENYTDDTALFVASGYPVCIFSGSYDNFNITTAEDLVLAKLRTDN